MDPEELLLLALLGQSPQFRQNPNAALRFLLPPEQPQRLELLPEPSPRPELTRQDVESVRQDALRGGKNIRLDPLDDDIELLREQIEFRRQEFNRPKTDVPLTRKQRFKEGVTGERGAALAAGFAANTDFSDKGSIATGVGSTAGTAIGFAAGGPVGAAIGGAIGGGLGGLVGGDDDDEKKAKKKRRLQELRINLANLAQFLNNSNQSLQQLVDSGRAFF